MAIGVGVPLVWGLLASVLMEMINWPALALVTSFIPLGFLHYWFAKNWPRELRRVAWFVGVLGGFAIFYYEVRIDWQDWGYDDENHEMMIQLIILVAYLATVIGFAWFAKRYLPELEISGRQPIISLTMSRLATIRTEWKVLLALASASAVIGIAGLSDALPQWSYRPVSNFFIGFILALGFGAFYGAKQYVERKFSDTGENRFGSQPRKSEEPPTPRAPQARQRAAAEERLKREAEEQDARVTSESLKAEFPKESPDDWLKKRARQLERKLREVEAKRR